MARIRNYMRGSAEQLEAVRERTREGFYDLDEGEIEWRDKADFLLQRGYRLRPRFMPGWKPSWEGSDILPNYCEDRLRATVRPLLVCEDLILTYIQELLRPGRSQNRGWEACHDQENQTIVARGVVRSIDHVSSGGSFQSLRARARYLL